jgi:hypothetical protein
MYVSTVEHLVTLWCSGRVHEAFKSPRRHRPRKYLFLPIHRSRPRVASAAQASRFVPKEQACPHPAMRRPDEGLGWSHR